MARKLSSYCFWRVSKRKHVSEITQISFRKLSWMRASQRGAFLTLFLMNFKLRHLALGGLIAAAGAVTSPAHAGTEAPLPACSDFGVSLFSLFATGCSVGDKNFRFSSADYSGTKLSTQIQVTLGSSNDGAVHTVNFQAAGSPNAWTGTGSMAYTVTVNNLTNETIKGLTGGVTTSVPGSALSATLAGTGTTSGDCPMSVPGITDCSLSGFVYSPTVTTSKITTSWTVTSGGLNSFTSSIIQTPGPLPILGAGAGFAFSRKIRRRISVAA
jgi:hypothetical protein